MRDNLGFWTKIEIKKKDYFLLIFCRWFAMNSNCVVYSYIYIVYIYVNNKQTRILFFFLKDHFVFHLYIKIYVQFDCDLKLIKLIDWLIHIRLKYWERWRKWMRALRGYCKIAQRHQAWSSKQASWIESRRSTRQSVPHSAKSRRAYASLESSIWIRTTRTSLGAHFFCCNNHAIVSYFD